MCQLVKNWTAPLARSDIAFFISAAVSAYPQAAASPSRAARGSPLVPEAVMISTTSKAAVQALAPMSDERPVAEDGLVKLSVRERHGTIVEAVRRRSEAGVGVDDLVIRRPTLDDVFLSLTGHAAEEPAEGDEAA